MDSKLTMIEKALYALSQGLFFSRYSLLASTEDVEIYQHLGWNLFARLLWPYVHFWRTYGTITYILFPVSNMSISIHIDLVDSTEENEVHQQARNGWLLLKMAKDAPSYAFQFILISVNDGPRSRSFCFTESIRTESPLIKALNSGRHAQQKYTWMAIDFISNGPICLQSDVLYTFICPTAIFSLGKLKNESR